MFGGRNTAENMDGFYSAVSAALSETEWNSCSISMEYDNNPVHHHSETDVKSSFHVLYSFKRMGKSFNFKSGHKVYKDDLDDNLSLFNRLKDSFVFRIKKLVDAKKIRLRVESEKFRIIFNLTKLE